MEPKFVTRDEFTVVGMECVGSAQSGDFWRLWQEFLPRMGEIKNAMHQCGAYGVCNCGPECKPEEGVCKCEESGASYIACVEVSDTTDIPAGMVSRTIPAAKYAIFTHKGSLDKLMNTYGYIYQTWLNESGCQLAGFYCFETYDERFKPVGDDSEIDIYVPVK